MKKNTLLMLPLVACMFACGNKQESKPADNSQQAEVSQELTDGADNSRFTTDSVGFGLETKKAIVNMWADFPKGGNAILVNAIREFISEEMGGSYMGDLSDADAMVRHYVNEAQKELNKLSDEFESDEAPTLSHSIGIQKLNETDKYVTYTAGEEVYLGGAHGSWISRAVTFRKSDGRRFDAHMLHDTDSEAFHLLLKEGVKSYFADATDDTQITDEMLKDMLLVESPVDYLPLPQYPPHLTAEGVAFCYQQYEIAPYAAGLPSFTIPYDKIRTYLTATALQMIE